MDGTRSQGSGRSTGLIGKEDERLGRDVLCLGKCPELPFCGTLSLLALAQQLVAHAQTLLALAQQLVALAQRLNAHAQPPYVTECLPYQNALI